MPNYGIIDLGSNTVRMCIYEVKDDSKAIYRRKKDFRSLVNHKVMAGLAAHVKDGQMTEQGILHAVDVLSGHLRRSGYFKCKRLDIFATAVLRNCTNSAEATATIEERIGMPITLLSAEDEAHLGFVGANSDVPLDEGTLIDIGGGSTELTHIEAGRDSHNISLGQGSLSSFANHVHSIFPTATEMQTIADDFEEKIRAEENYDSYHHPQLFGVGGSVRAAAKMYAEISQASERPRYLTPANIDDIIALYQQDPGGFAHTALKATPDRIHTLLPGCIILRQIMQDFDTENLYLCKGGVREGYLIERILEGTCCA